MMYRHPAASGGKTLTMLLAVAVAGGTAALRMPSEDTKPPHVESPRIEPQRVTKPALPDEPLVLRTDAPACGNVMSKMGPSPECRQRRWIRK